MVRREEERGRRGRLLAHGPPGPEVMMGKAIDIPPSALLAMNQHVLAIAHMMPVGWESR